MHVGLVMHVEAGHARRGCGLWLEVVVYGTSVVYSGLGYLAM